MPFIAHDAGKTMNRYAATGRHNRAAAATEAAKLRPRGFCATKRPAWSAVLLAQCY